MALPAAGTFNADDDLEEGEKRQALEDMRGSIAELIGGSGVQDVEIAGGIITPEAGESGTLRVETEGAASSDNLDNIDLADVPEGRHLLILLKDEGHVVTLRHNTGAATGRFSLIPPLPLDLNDLSQWIEVRREGDTVFEVRRGGREKERVVGVGSAPAYSGSWAGYASGGVQALRFFRGADGMVNARGRAEHAALGTNPTGVFTFPAGCRPGGVMLFPICVDHGGTDEIWRAAVSTSGLVTVRRLAGTPSADTIIDLSTIYFRAEA